MEDYLESELEGLDKELEKIERRKRIIKFDQALKSEENAELWEQLILLNVRILEYQDGYRPLTISQVTQTRIDALKRQIAFFEHRLKEMQEQLSSLIGKTPAELDALKEIICEEYDKFLDLLTGTGVDFSLDLLPPDVQKTIKEVKNVSDWSESDE